MRVLLIKPNWSYPVDKADSTYNRRWPPLDLLNCAAFLHRRGHHAAILDASVEALDTDELAARATAFDRVFITSTSLDRWQCPNIDLSAFLRAVEALRRAQVTFHVMGTHGTVRPHDILELTNAATVIRGEPEAAVVEVSERDDPAAIAGITYRRHDEIRSTPDREPLPLEEFPLPAFDLLDYDRYSYEVLGDRFALLETSRGCPFSCTFCVKSMYGKGMRLKTLAQVHTEIDYLVDKLRIRSVYFIDLEFTLHEERVLAVCEHLRVRGRPFVWCCQTRADAVSSRILEAMKAAGCAIIHFGVESGSEKISGTLSKRISIDQVETGVSLTKRAGIKTVCFFMFGLPGEQVPDMAETLAFAKRLNPTYASFHVALPYPGTAFYEMVRPRLSDDLFPRSYDGDVPNKKLQRFVRWAFFAYYFRPGYLIGRWRDEGWRALIHEGVFFLRYFWSRWVK
ncbi:B12-binding domain-containing radical SAM protein [bacterium]|nr:B12-binding domain-containing radical SAM protein [candidate division CSSED10-310 bacterium]